MSLPAQSLTQDDNTALFRKAWTLYDTITERNYMFHREIYAHIADLLRQRRQSGSYTVLDLGCGNARFLAPCLHAAPPAAYIGVDLSATALEEALGHLRGLAGITLQQQDLLQAVTGSESTFDIIFTGFAVHHLDSAAKQQLFHACARRLAPGGQFIMVDVLREEGQSREQYLEGYLNFMRTQWTEVLPEHIDEACAHVAAYDFPETLAELTRMAKQATLSQTRLISRHAQHHVLRFTA
ncbi:class I SAM-dependent methyltransferase [Prosthecobacter sp.]|uniref:class I SAM-dependent methyltransferase n=1 Tax=Prosthecobacter sp. TaxID=1965333 RepID=UPI002AB90E15|nr:class I SAM-dependent methyltransferase [Prosthecobacter sp.]MDZ4405080.1 class I SAM-dependent methyltransferase [Prosthecobacter sp.]